MKKENNLITFIKGFIIGLGIIFPISASGLAVSLGLYERILNIINNIKTSLKKELGFIIAFGLGVVVSGVVSCLLIKVTYEIYPIATLLFFEGLIVGGLPLIFKKTNKEYNLKNIIWLIIGAIILISISFVGNGADAIISSDIKGLITIFFVGALAAGTMIIPGVSGSLILVIIGYYKPMLDVISQIFHFNNLGTNILTAAIFSIGMILGILIMSKLMDFFLTKFERKSYFTIIGFIIASIINVLLLICSYGFNLMQTIIGIVLFTIAFLIAFKFLKEE